MLFRSSPDSSVLLDVVVACILTTGWFAKANKMSSRNRVGSMLIEIKCYIISVISGTLLNGFFRKAFFNTRNEEGVD